MGLQAMAEDCLHMGTVELEPATAMASSASGASRPLQFAAFFDPRIDEKVTWVTDWLGLLFGLNSP